MVVVKSFSNIRANKNTVLKPQQTTLSLSITKKPINTTISISKFPRKLIHKPAPKLKSAILTTVSIIITCFNTEKYIIKCLESCINQTFKDFEIIIIDDCSTDGTLNKINEYIDSINGPTNEKKYSFKVIKNNKNVGTYISRNIGIQNSHGKYFTILDSDDYYHKEKLEKQVKILDNNKNIVATWHIWCRVNENGEILYQRDNKGFIAFLYRRDIINDIGYFDSVRFGADSEFEHRLRTYYPPNKLYKIPEILYYALSRDGSLSKKISDDLRKKMEVYSKNYKNWHKNKDLYMEFPLKKRPFEIIPNS